MAACIERIMSWKSSNVLTRKFGVGIGPVSKKMAVNYNTIAFDSTIGLFLNRYIFFTRWSLKRGGMYRKNYELKEQQRFDEKISETNGWATDSNVWILLRNSSIESKQYLQDLGDSKRHVVQVLSQKEKIHFFIQSDLQFLQ